MQGGLGTFELGNVAADFENGQGLALVVAPQGPQDRNDDFFSILAVADQFPSKRSSAGGEAGACPAGAGPASRVAPRMAAART